MGSPPWMPSLRVARLARSSDVMVQNFRVLVSVIIGDPGVGTDLPANFCQFDGVAVWTVVGQVELNSGFLSPSPQPTSPSSIHRLNHHLNIDHETFQVLDQTVPSTLEKVI
ncbi:uncharacterized protein [Malus domestica]|uniref:uncharacterized protein isoform X2 n=1 Tax=Malus domestica TaxID=3750 RepID=UPI0010AACF06|nr:uncharacterized protein LOC103439600 isoform X3 [Malus domestica]